MKVILLENIKGVGKKDEVINAADGYARNYLLPKKLAIPADTGNMNNLKAKQASNEFRKGEEKKEAEEIAKKLKGILLKIQVKSGENGKIFGGVTSKEIAEELKKQYKIDIDKKKIMLEQTIKTIGVFNIDIKLFEGVIGKLKVNILGNS